jgi:phosphoribosyl 1,2-cyclic phosphodiesterase
MTDHGLQIRFWGTRGNAAPRVPGREFGIHTTCVEVRAAGGAPLLVDAGTGVIGAAQALLAEGVREFDLFLTHLHIDHLQGLVSFAPLYRADCTVRVHAARTDVEPAFRTLFAAPFHPVPLERLAARLEFRRLPECGAVAVPPRLGLAVRCAPVAHPGGCTAYRFDAGGSALVFATDVELGAPVSHAPLEALLAEPQPAGLAVVDGFFADAEIDQYADWGHSSAGQVLELLRRTRVAAGWITHHHPNQTDARLRRHEAEAPPLRWARDGEVVRLVGNQVVAPV